MHLLYEFRSQYLFPFLSRPFKKNEDYVLLKSTKPSSLTLHFGRATKYRANNIFETCSGPIQAGPIRMFSVNIENGCSKKPVCTYEFPAEDGKFTRDRYFRLALDPEGPQEKLHMVSVYRETTPTTSLTLLDVSGIANFIEADSNLDPKILKLDFSKFEGIHSYFDFLTRRQKKQNLKTVELTQEAATYADNYLQSHSTHTLNQDKNDSKCVIL